MAGIVWKIPGGRNKDMPITEAPDQDVKYYAENARREDLKAACIAELERRKAGGAVAPRSQAPATTQAATAAPRSSAVVVSGAFSDAKKATDALQAASLAAHLVAPATVCATLPEGCEVALAAVIVDPLETYELPGGKVGLGKTALDKIAAAAGISWDPVLSCRLDDASDPHYCHYRAAGTVRTFDGQIRTLCGEVEIDAREGSPQIEEIVVKAESSNPPRDPYKQILELRKFLLRHAESKAKNRAIRSMGLRTGYNKDELQKPFVVAKIMFTGQSTDPEARREFRQMIGQSFLGSSVSLYGNQEQQPGRHVRQVEHAQFAHRPPPIGSITAGNEPIEVTRTSATDQGNQEDECACPDGPAGQHLDECQFAGAEQY